MNRPTSAALALGLVAGVLGPETAWAQEPDAMATTTPFVQSKATDAAGHVSYRVGAVFASQKAAERRLSLTFICEPGGKAVSLYIVHTQAPRDPRSPPKALAKIDAQPLQPIDVTRETGNALAAYTDKNSSQVKSLMAQMGAGQTLVLTLDDDSYRVSLDGLAKELKDLASVCPYT